MKIQIKHIDMWQRLLDYVRGYGGILGARSSQWSKTRKEYLKLHPLC